jgi:6-phosphofructokinase 1
MMELESCYKFLRAGAFKEIAFRADEVRAAIVSSGGLCPGVNAVIKSIV